MNNDNSIITLCLLVLLALPISLVAGSCYETYKATEMIKNGADPIKVACLFDRNKCAFVK